jgi:beta-aspartyl-dipeptidase (metallo-type)
MLTLLKNCSVYAPAPLGRRDILIAGGSIEAMEEDLSRFEGLPDVETVDVGGALACPGLFDIHVHVTGGGGEQGPTSRMPELSLEDFTANGVSCVVGLLGTDGVSRSLENLLFKVRALEEEGLSAWMLTGNYRVPTKTLSGDVERDIALVDKIVGAKTALADHRDSAATAQELARLGTEVRIGSMISGKKGVVTIHMGASKRCMETLFAALEISDLPPETFLPTHCCRSEELIRDAVKFNQMGGYIDFTADPDPRSDGTAKALERAIELGADPSRICMSSDGGGSQPVFDERGNCLRIDSATSASLLEEFRRMVCRDGFAIQQALAFFTENPARLLGLQKTKGSLAPGMDADVLVLDEQFRPKSLWSKGKKLL